MNNVYRLTDGTPRYGSAVHVGITPTAAEHDPAGQPRTGND
ncbi:hypothetical protein [Chloroflexus aggregans]|nr:hypothetical protein [Chloroflexus aggregans]